MTGTRQNAGKRGVGRPTRITPAEISQAVLEIGTQHVTMRKVAERLGVSLPGLYHHVRNQDELLELAARRALEEQPPPSYAGQPWDAWLTIFARYIRSALAADPALLPQMLAGRLEIEGDVEYNAESVESLVAQGFLPEQALSAWTAVSELALGSVVEARREALRTADGLPWLARLHALLGRHPKASYEAMRSLASDRHDPYLDEQFERRLRMLLRGISLESGVAPSQA